MPTRGFGTLSTYFWKSIICRSLYRMMHGISPFECLIVCTYLLLFNICNTVNISSATFPLVGTPFFFSRFDVWDYEVVASCWEHWLRLSTTLSKMVSFLILFELSSSLKNTRYQQQFSSLICVYRSLCFLNSLQLPLIWMFSL